MKNFYLIKYTAFILLYFFAARPLEAQEGIGEFLKIIEENNSTLKALRLQAEAEKKENYTDINMSDPDIEAGYSWGDRRAEGDRYEINVKQAFDFPTAYGYRKKIAAMRNKESDFEYERQRREILLEARLLYVESAYRSENKKVLAERVEKARQLFEAYEKRMKNGDADIIEYNKTRLDLVNTEKKYQLNDLELDNIMKEICRLNGGQPCGFSDFNYSGYLPPADFERWFEGVKLKNPILRLSSQQIQTANMQVKLMQALSLPKFTAGYHNGFEAGARFNGFIVGMTVPLWENKNKVKASKAKSIALEMEYKDEALQFYNTLQNQYNKAVKLKALLEEYEKLLSYSNDYDLLKKALEQGQMSAITFIQELTVYYETVDLFMETRRDLGLASARLEQWED